MVDFFDRASSEDDHGRTSWLRQAKLELGAMTGMHEAGGRETQTIA